MKPLADFPAHLARRGTVLASNGSEHEAGGVLNPASTRDRDGRLVLYPRLVAAGNVSRIGLALGSERNGAVSFKRIGLALEPLATYECRSAAGGYGCEDARVTFVPLLDAYLMAYTAFGPDGPRLALARSHDGYVWRRLGLVDLAHTGLPDGDDKDVAFFPEPLYAPNGALSFAFYHRPMHPAATPYGESIRIAYVSVERVLHDERALLAPHESALVLAPQGTWGLLKTGGGTPPVRIAEGWLSLYHAVDVVAHADGRLTRCYRAGVVVHDLDRPHVVRYRSPQPLLEPVTHAERCGIVNDVVFPTAIDPVPGSDGREFDIFYGMADAQIGHARLTLPALASETDAETAQRAA